jgi:hypothetical protein
MVQNQRTARAKVRDRYTTFVGIDLGGAKGKSTAVARLGLFDGDRRAAAVEEVRTRFRGAEPWGDDALVDYVTSLGDGVVVAIDAPLTVPACVRCVRPACPGYQGCEDPATVWLRTVGADLREQAMAADQDRIAAVPAGAVARVPPPPPSRAMAPYTHRCTEVLLHYGHDLVPRENLSQANSPIAARAAHLRRVLAGRGFALNENLLEVSPRGTVHALFGGRRARGYKRDADPWQTRAAIVEDLDATLRFAPSSRLAREEVLRNDHCFDALLAGYTAFLWARDGWTMPDGETTPFAEDGWIWIPPPR